MAALPLQQGCKQVRPILRSCTESHCALGRVIYARTWQSHPQLNSDAPPASYRAFARLRLGDHAASQCSYFDPSRLLSVLLSRITPRVLALIRARRTNQPMSPLRRTPDLAQVQVRSPTSSITITRGNPVRVKLPILEPAGCAPQNMVLQGASILHALRGGRALSTRQLGGLLTPSTSPQALSTSSIRRESSRIPRFLVLGSISETAFLVGNRHLRAFRSQIVSLVLFDDDRVQLCRSAIM